MLCSGFHAARDMLPPDLARLRVEGGAPYLHEQGSPPYVVDKWDTSLTHPQGAVTAVKSCCVGIAAYSRGSPAPVEM
jgi:hypothetical protein